MSLKPIKITDQNKRWMQPRRDRHRLIQPEYHLIVTEGTETEPPYFEAMGKVINKNYPGKICFSIKGEGDNTLSLYAKARKLVAKSANGYRHVWVIYDTDDFPPKSIDETARLCDADSNDETTYHAIWSNQCIELWFLLHFSFMQSDLHRSEYWPKLTMALKSIGKGEYKKNRDDMFHILYPYMDDAITNAKNLERMNEGKTPSKSAPGTKIYVLVEKLKPYLDASV